MDIYSKEFFIQSGKKGGKKTAKKGKKYYQELQKLSLESRKRNKELSTPTDLE